MHGLDESPSKGCGGHYTTIQRKDQTSAEIPRLKHGRNRQLATAADLAARNAEFFRLDHHSRSIVQIAP